MGAMQFEGHGGRSKQRAGMHWGPLKSFDWVLRHRARAWRHGARSHKVGGWPSKPKHGDIGGHGARSHGTMEAWVGGHGGRGPWRADGGGGRAEQAERAERAGMHWGPLKSFDRV